MFPNAKFVFLVRNPLSVFASILDYNFKGNFRRLLSSKDRIDDLFLAPELIKKSINSNSNHILIHYEDLIENTEKVLSGLFDYLELDKPKDMDSYQMDNTFRNSDSVDTKSLNNHSSASSDYFQAWKVSVNSTQKKRLALDYINHLKTNFSSYFDYNLDEIEKEILAHKPSKNSIFNLGLNSLSKNDSELSLKKIVLKRLFLKLQRQ